MNKILQLSPAATVTISQHGVLLQSDLGDFHLHGKDIRDFISHIMPLLDAAKYTREEIIELLTMFSPQSVEAVLDLLLEKGLLESHSQDINTGPPWKPHERFFKAWNSTIKRSTDTLKDARVLIIGLEPWALNLVEELAIAGVGHIHILDNDCVRPDDQAYYRDFSVQDIGLARGQAIQHRLSSQTPWCRVSNTSLQLDQEKKLHIDGSCKWDLVIVSLSKEAQFWQEKVARFVHQNQFKTLYGSLEGLTCHIGPLVIQNNDACWNCLRLRRLGAAHNPQMAHELDKASNEAMQTSRSRAMLRSMSTIAGQQLAMEAIKILIQYTSSNLRNHVRSYNTVTGESSSHKIIPVPWCDVCEFGCGQKQLLTTQPPNYSAAMSAVASNTDMSSNPLNQITDLEQLNTLFAGWIDSDTGVIKQLTGHLHTLPDFPMTASAGVASFSAGQFDPRTVGQIGSGKGLDEISAHIGAIGEALERYSAARYRKSDCVYATIKQLNAEYVDPKKLVLYSDEQYRDPTFPFTKWRDKQKIHWVKGVWIGTEHSVWVPALTSYFNFTCPIQEQFTQVSSNGLAAGQNNQDAAIRAAYELIERDAMMLTWYAQLPCQRLHIDSQYSGKMRLMIDNITERGIQLEIYLLDVGLHIPTVVCLALGDGRQTPAVSVALATHGDINIAMRKALLEQGHVMPYLCYLMSKGEQLPRSAEEVTSLEDHAAYYFAKDKLSAFNFMRQPHSAAIHVEDWPYAKVTGIDDLRSRVLGAGVDIAVVDVTSPDIALSPFRVARAVGVNMQPIHFGEQFKRVDNPRLQALLQGRAVNNNPHPIA